MTSIRASVRESRQILPQSFFAPAHHDNSTALEIEEYGKIPHVFRLFAS